MSTKKFVLFITGAFVLSFMAGVYFAGESGTISQSAIENFSESIQVKDGRRCGKEGWLTFELYRQGTFLINGTSGYAWQISNSYRDSAIIRSSKPLPDTYKISIVAGEIDYDLEKIKDLDGDPEYEEGPQKENGCYLLSITDTKPGGHYTNDWWHKHRKLVIDVDNNAYGSGMPNPIFMVYFDRDNELVAFDGRKDEWAYAWKKAVEYEKQRWYRIEIEKTATHYILSILNENGMLLKRAMVEREKVWHSEVSYPEYFVVGDPHENYYQGTMKIKSVEITV